MFCMLLRKHLSGGRILSIAQPHLERVVEIRLEALDELGGRAEAPTRGWTPWDRRAGGGCWTGWRDC